VVFGSVFGLHGIVSPLWIDPLADPIRVLVVPLYVGAALVMAGYLLQGIEAGWGGRLREWLVCDVGQPLAYAGIVGAFVLPRAAWLAAGGAILAIAGSGIHGKSWLAAARALGELVERTMQALINTLSFARVGAFALAHAGLSSAISVLASASGSAPLEVLIVVLGNIVVIALEALVVSIQTTRLVLFEFFTRFLKAEGRVFHPLPPPPSTQSQET
jgi:V/A-type H+-transporting ATPase subunit I